MKSLLKLSFLLFFTIMLMQTVQAQVGLKAGYNLSTIKFFTDDDTDFNENFINGYQIGLVYFAGLGDKLSVQPEIAYFVNGGDSDFGASNAKRQYQNIKVNGLLNYNIIGGNDGIGLFATGGVFATYSVGARVEFAGVESIIDFGDNDEFSRTNVGYVLGAGLKLNRFILSLRGSFGVSEIVSFDNSNTVAANGNIKSRDYSFLAIILF